MLRDFSFTGRRLARTPGFSITVVLLLGLALGACACVFSVAYGLLYKPLPFADGERLVTIESRLTHMNINLGVSVPLLERIAHSARTLQSVAGYRKKAVDVSDDSDPKAAPWRVAYAQPTLFQVLRVDAALGRLFADDEARDGAAPVALLDWQTWQTRYAGAPDAIGRNLRLADKDYRIVGVLPRGFTLAGNDPQVWLPLTFDADSRSTAKAGYFTDVYAVARLRDGSSVADASGEIDALARELDGLKEILDVTGFKASVAPLRSMWIAQREAALRLMLLAVAMVLLVTAANVCNLTIARQLARRHETAVLEALGAGTARLLLQLAGEALCLCAAAAALAFVVLPAGLSLLAAFELLPTDTPQRIGADSATAFFIGALALLVAAAMTLSAGAFKHRDVHAAIKQGGRRQTASGPAQRARQALIVAQIALTGALLVGTGLLLRSSQALLDEDVGFARDHLLMATLMMGGEMRAAASESPDAAVRTLIERARGLPGVEAVGAGSAAPFGSSDSISNFLPPGVAEVEQQKQPRARMVSVDADYFAALGLPLRTGRAFSAAETDDKAAVAIVDEEFVQRYLAGRDPLGVSFKIPAPGKDGAMRDVAIVGVARTVKQRALDEHAEHATIYLPQTTPDGPMLLLRSAGDPALLAAPFEQLLHEIAPRAKAMGVFSMHEWIERTVRDRARLNTLLELLGAMALLLATVGLYAVLAFSVRLRTAEFGIRMALGASAAGVRRGVLLQGARLVAVGLLLGAPLAYALARALEARLYHVGTFDPLTLAGVAALLGAVGVFACWLPAWRAARVDPIEALRYE